MDPRLIHQYEKKIALEPPKRGRKPKSWHKDKNSNRHKSSSTKVSTTADSSDSSDSDEDQKKKKQQKPKTPSVSFISQTLSGRTPKPPERYQGEKKKSRHRHKSSSGNKSRGRDDESTDDEVILSPTTRAIDVNVNLGSSDGSSQISPALSVSSNSSRKGKIGITIKKSPNSDRSYETSLIGGEDDDDDDVDDDDEEDDDYENFKSSLLEDDDEDEVTFKNGGFKRKKSLDGKFAKRAKPSSKVKASVLLDSDSEYEVEEVIELREWYPPDFWRSQLQPEDLKFSLTDVTVQDLTVTMRESRTKEGFFKEL